MDQIGDQRLAAILFKLVDQGSGGNVHDHVLSGPTVTHPSLTGLPVFRLVDPLVPEIVQTEQFFTGPEDHVTAFSPVTTVRSSLGNILFPTKRRATGTAFSRTNENLGFIHKSHDFLILLSLTGFASETFLNFF